MPPPPLPSQLCSSASQDGLRPSPGPGAQDLIITLLPHTLLWSPHEGNLLTTQLRVRWAPGGRGRGADLRGPEGRGRGPGTDLEFCPPRPHAPSPGLSSGLPTHGVLDPGSSPPLARSPDAHLEEAASFISLSVGPALPVAGRRIPCYSSAPPVGTCPELWHIGSN